MVGHNVDLSYSYDHLGESTQVLQEIAAGTHPFCKVVMLQFIWSFDCHTLPIRLYEFE